MHGSTGGDWRVHIVDEDGKTTEGRVMRLRRG